MAANRMTTSMYSQLDGRSFQEASTQTTGELTRYKRISELLAKRPASEKCRRKIYNPPPLDGVVNMGFDITPTNSPPAYRRQKCHAAPQSPLAGIKGVKAILSSGASNEQRPIPRQRPQTAPNSPGSVIRWPPKPLSASNSRRNSSQQLQLQQQQQQLPHQFQRQKQHSTAAGKRAGSAGCLVRGPVSITTASDAEKEEYISPIFNMPRTRQGTRNCRVNNQGYELMMFRSNIVI